MLYLLQRVQPGAAAAFRHLMPLKLSRTVRCLSCDITLNSPQQARQHYSGKAHQRRLQKLHHHQQQKEPRPPDTEKEARTSESRDEELKQEAATDDETESPSSCIDSVVSDQSRTVDVDSVLPTQYSAGEFTHMIVLSWGPRA